MSRHSGKQKYHSPKSYEIFDDESVDKSDRLYSETDGIDDEYVMEDLVSIIKSIKREKCRRKQPRNDRKDVSEASSCDDDESQTEIEDNHIQHQMLKEKKYIKREQKQIQKVHRELCDINDKLQLENKNLRLWDVQLKERESHLDISEKKLSEYAASLEELINKEVGKQCAAMEEDCERKIQHACNETKKIRNSFKILKNANETFKKQAQSDSVKMKAYEEKHTALQNRISNLQRKNEILVQQLKESSLTASTQTSKDKVANVCKKKDTTYQQIPSTFFEVFATLLRWLSNVHLQRNVNSILKTDKQPFSQQTVECETTNETCIKVMISLPHILHEISNMADNLQLAYMQFIYWSLLHAHITQSSQRFSHSTTYRRIGEELYSAKAVRPSKGQKEIPEESAFFNSANLEIRLLSSFIILHTVSKADIISKTFHNLNMDLRLELAKKIFIENHCAVLLLASFKLTNKVNLLLTTDILMLMTTESPFLQPFLLSISSIEWIQAILSVMKNCQDNVPLMEKLSLMLQRLTKIRSNKSIFNALQVYNIMAELHRTCDPTEEFLQLNLRSILFNIDSMNSTNEK